MVPNRATHQIFRLKSEKIRILRISENYSILQKSVNISFSRSLLYEINILLQKYFFYVKKFGSREDWRLFILIYPPTVSYRMFWVFLNFMYLIVLWILWRHFITISIFFCFLSKLFFCSFFWSSVCTEMSWKFCQ